MDQRLHERGVFFLPWVGAAYAASAGPRLLILGESHYSDAAGQTPQLTRSCIEEHARREWNHRFFTMLTQLVSGMDHWRVDRQAFWQGLAFYNYVQRSVADGPGVAPTADDFERDETALRAVVEALAPTHVLVCSWRLWHHLPRALFGPGPHATTPQGTEIWPLATTPPALALGIPHPSRAARAPVGASVACFLAA
ncbi:hypothetical protein [Melaminivora sp.]|uniref:hypothetical protein n=1 Tax=Melaminivora sp. TaxID=1933032 RepID=UPI0028AF3E49|nr:hypothetical protein [Melaminivora sp.]